MKQLSVQWISYHSGLGAEVQVVGGGRQVYLMAEQCGIGGCRGGGCLSFQTLRQEARQSPEHTHTEVC